MQIDQALDLLKTKCPDYHKNQSEIISTLNLQGSSTLKSYLELIQNDPVTYFESFPKSAVSFIALAKPKSAILYLLEKCDQVRQSEGAQFCDALANTIGKEWKQHGKRIAEARTLESKDDSTDEETNPRSSIALSIQNTPVEEVPLRHLREQLETEKTLSSERLARIQQLEVELAKSIKDFEKHKEEIASMFEVYKNLFVNAMKKKGATELEIELLTLLTFR